MVGIVATAALFVVLLAASVVGVVTHHRGDGVPLDEFDLLAEPLDPTRSPVDAHLLWAIGFANGAATTRDEIEARFDPAFLASIPFEELLTDRDQFLADAPYRVRGRLVDHTEVAGVGLIGRSGAPYLLLMSATPQGPSRIAGLSLTPARFETQPFGSGRLALVISTALALAVAGCLVLRTSRTDTALGAGLIAASLLDIGQLGLSSPVGVLFTVGLWCGPLAVATAAIAVALALPGTRSRQALAGMIAAAATLAGVAVSALDTASVGLPAIVGGIGPTGAARTLLTTRALVATAAGVALAATLAWSLLRGRLTSRWTLLSVGGVVSGLLTALLALSWLAPGAHPRVTTSGWLDAALLVVAAGAIGSVGLDRWGDHGVARLVTDLGEERAPVALHESVGRALDDPSVEVWYWSAEVDHYVTADGAHRDPERLGPERIATRLSARGEPLAVVVHDAALGIPDSRVAAVCAAARMALDNERLQARVRAQLSEVRASRARIVAAADDARRSIERDLHDGAQQRLLAVLLQLRRAEAGGGLPRADVTDTSGRTDRTDRTELAALRAELGRAADELAGALDDVRAIARGLHPPALDHGLAAALETLAESAPLPVELDLADPLPPLEPPLAAATYFGVAEALTNTVRHADATHLAVGVRCRDGVLAVVVADDGRGGARLARGTGLQHLADRVAALGGTLGLDSPPGRGTVVRLDLPLAPEPDVGHAVDPVTASLTDGVSP